MPTITGETMVSIAGPEVDKIFFDPIFLGMEPSGFTVMTNVISKKPLGFAGVMDKILQADTGCGWKPKGEFALYKRWIETDPIKVNLDTCATTLNDTIWEKTKRKGAEDNNTIGTTLSSILLVRIKQGIQLDTNRLYWFGNKASTDVDYNLSDGFWTVHIPALVGSNAMPYIDSGSGAPLAQDDATNLLEKMWLAQSLELKGLPKASKRFMVSSSVYNAYMKDLELTIGGDAGRTAMINGVETLAYRGIALQEEVYWNHYDEVDFDLPEQHRALLTTPSNLVIATDLMSSKNSIDIWYDKKFELVHYKAKFKLGTNYVHPSLMVAAY